MRHGGCDLQRLFKIGLVRHIIGSEGYDDCALAEDMSGGLLWLVWYHDPTFVEETAHCNHVTTRP